MASASPSSASTAEPPALLVKDLSFAYDRSLPPVLRDISVTVKPGARLLLVGDNGAGKTTLLRILAGRHKHREGAVQVLGRESFFDTSLDVHRSYMGSDWGRRTVAFAGYG